jgi:hypothetical protein
MLLKEVFNQDWLCSAFLFFSFFHVSIMSNQILLKYGGIFLNFIFSWRMGKFSLEGNLWNIPFLIIIIIIIFDLPGFYQTNIDNDIDTNYMKHMNIIFN